MLPSLIGGLCLIQPCGDGVGARKVLIRDTGTLPDGETNARVAERVGNRRIVT